jgi:hypothetical protein
VEKWIRFVYFKLLFRINFVKLCRRHPRDELLGILECVLPMARVRKFSLGCPQKKAYKTKINEPGEAGRHL